jgi:sulfite reductase (NADPH) hemoprotein beta-component
VVHAVETIIEIYCDRRRHGEYFIDTFRRIGLEPFKEQLYAFA